MIKRLIFICLFISSLASADGKIVGHMEPLDSERISPIVLDQCPGLTIYESRRDIDSESIAELNSICKVAMERFWPFIKSKELQVQNDYSFEYSIALLQDTKAYRGLNDVNYRFYYRPMKEEVWAYTSKTLRWMFIINDIEMKRFTLIFSHEIFHMMSIHYGLYDGHGGTEANKERTDEGLAREFTEYLGLGK